jgi:hypothetical protein
MLCAERTKIEYSLDLGYIASLLLRYLPAWKAFTALLYIMESSKRRASNYFHDTSLAKLAEVWDQVLSKKASTVHEKLGALKVEHKEYLTPWLQTAFLKTTFAVKLKLRVFDRFVNFGTPALFSFGLVIVHQVNQGILNTKHPHDCVRLLQDPSNSSSFQSVPPVLKKLNSLWIQKKDYQDYCHKAGVTHCEVP